MTSSLLPPASSAASPLTARDAGATGPAKGFLPRGRCAPADDGRAVAAHGERGADELAAGEIAESDHARAARPAEGFQAGGGIAVADRGRVVSADTCADAVDGAPTQIPRAGQTWCGAGRTPKDQRRGELCLSN